jgi:hypothetical protein
MNSVFILPEALRERGTKIAEGLCPFLSAPNGEVEMQRRAVAEGTWTHLNHLLYWQRRKRSG